MFKCNDCGKVYNTKPDYCECGNDEFSVVELQSKQAKNNINYSKPVKKPLSTNEIYSRFIFVICIILSLLIVFTVKLPKNVEESISEVKNELKAEIPTIDELWENPDNRNKNSLVNNTNNIVKNLLKQQPQQAQPQQKQNIQQPKQQKVAQTPKVNNQNNVIKANNNQNNTPKKVQQNKNNNQAQQIAQQQAQQLAQQQAQQQAQQAKQDLINYKNGLQRTLYSKLNIANMIGQGTCIVEFTISSSGVLENRSFAKLSNNQSIDDAVYNMMMLTPAFNPPPAAYKGEKIKLQFSFNNGIYEMGFVN